MAPLRQAPLRQAPLRRRLRTLILAPTIRLIVGVFGRLPWSVAQRLGGALGLTIYWLSRRDRGRCLEHLTIAFPHREETARKALARASFRHLGMSAGELLHLHHRPEGEASRHVEVVGFDEIERCRAAGKPIVVMTGHCGNWELLSTANHSHGLGLAAIAREMDDAALQQLIVDFRSHLGSENIARGSRTSSRQLLRTVRRGGALVMLIDQDIRTDGVFVPFFGRLAHTPPAAAEIALRLGAQVVPTFAERLEDGSHRVVFQPALDLPSDVTEATALMTLKIEEQIRRRPEQWVWMHKRWRRQPPADSPPDRRPPAEAPADAGSRIVS